jgi:hypothetical protein
MEGEEVLTTFLKRQWKYENNSLMATFNKKKNVVNEVT